MISTQWLWWAVKTEAQVQAEFTVSWTKPILPRLSKTMASDSIHHPSSQWSAPIIQTTWQTMGPWVVQILSPPKQWSTWTNCHQVGVTRANLDNTTLAKAPSEVRMATRSHHSTQTTTSLGQGDISMLRMKWNRRLMRNQSLKMERKILATSMDSKMFTIRMRLKIGHPLSARVEFMTWLEFQEDLSLPLLPSLKEGMCLNSHQLQEQPIISEVVVTLEEFHQV